jgi:hypothetical protein
MDAAAAVTDRGEEHGSGGIGSLGLGPPGGMEMESSDLHLLMMADTQSEGTLEGTFDM